MASATSATSTTSARRGRRRRRNVCWRLWSTTASTAFPSSCDAFFDRFRAARSCSKIRVAFFALKEMRSSTFAVVHWLATDRHFGFWALGTGTTTKSARRIRRTRLLRFSFLHSSDVGMQSPHSAFICHHALKSHLHGLFSRLHGLFSLELLFKLQL